MSADSIAISRDLVKAGADKDLADAIAQKIVAHSGGSAETKAELARVEAEAKADREARAEKESTTKEDISEIKIRLSRIESYIAALKKEDISEIKIRLSRIESYIAALKTSGKWAMGVLVAVFAGVAVLVIDKLF